MEALSKEYGECFIDIKLDETVKENILVSTPFQKKKHFYLNQKACLLKASGKISFGDNTYNLNEDDSYGLMDWGRGNLPFKHNWMWGNGSGIVNGVKFGFNIGSFGNNINGSENIFFYGDKYHKIDEIIVECNDSNYMDEWHYHAKDGSFEFTMSPIYDNHTKTKILWVNNECHQVFGYFNGYILLDDEKIEINNFLAFTEKARNRW